VECISGTQRVGIVVVDVGTRIQLRLAYTQGELEASEHGATCIVRSETWRCCDHVVNRLIEKT